MADDEKRDASSSSSSEEEQIEMVKMDNPAPKLPNPQRIMSTTDVAKYDELLLNMRKYKSQHNIPDMSGATIQLKNVSFELDVPVGGSVKTMTHSLRPKDHIKSFKSLFQKEKEPKTVTKQILKNVSLTIKPKTMTLLLGPPGCGRSTLLKLIARLAVKGRMSGELLINGQNPHKRAHHHYVSYVTQDDNHLPTFKVYQTAYFASLLLGKPELSNKEKMARADELLKQLGLDHRRDTVIGNDYIRGLSGGERKRMTIAISMLKESQCLLLDEPTTGLDANTSLELFRFCNVIKDMIPVFATLLQPSAELFFQFDNLVLMDEGRILYSGPTTEALPFFAKCGFVCPENKNPADFLLEMIEKLRKYKDRPAALDNPNPEPVEQYVNVNQEIDEELRNRASYNASFMLQMALNIWRGFALVKNYPWPFMIRMIKTIVVAIVYGSAYWQLGNTQADLINRISIGFSVVLFAGLASISNMGPYFEIRPVYYMQKMNYYYSPLAFFLGTLIVDLPLCMFESTIFGTIVYWMSGLKTTFQAFIFFLAVVFVLSFLILSMVRMTAFGVEIIEQAQGLIPLFIVLQLFFTGFLITYSTAWDGLAWLFWISPFNYGNQALCINELEGTTFRCTKKELMPPTNLPEFDLPFKKGGFGGQQICPVTNGEQFLESIDFKTPNEYKVYYFLVVLGMCAIFQVLAYLTMRFCYFPPPPPKGVGAMKDKEEDDPEDKSRESTGKSEAYMSWRDVSYTVEVRKSTFSLRKKKLQLLYNIDGYVKPGMMLALMGPSGAGKSTLLDVLARRKTSGKITGDILVNGKKLDTATFSHIMGYVEQQNLHIETVTVKEAILFSAYLRLSEKLSKEEKIEHAKWVLRALELDVIQDTILFQLSFEQMKRVTIGVELAADPAILFLDEPTSGLDARAAALVMQCVKNIAINSGKAVICTIHQPAEPVFRLFSDLLLLKRGGNTIYFGPIGENYSTLLEYFDRNFGEKPELMRNPADFILDMCTVTTHDFAKVYDESPEHKNAVEIIDKGIVPEGFQKPEKRNYYSASFWEQYKYLTHRAITFWWRQPQVVWGSVVINTFLGLFMGLLYYQLPHDQSGLINRTALIYLGTLLPAMSTILFIALFIGERPTYTREQSSATYHPLFYVAGIFSAHIPLNFIAVIILSSGFYFLSGLRTEGSPHYFFFLVLASTGNVMVFMAVHMVCAVAFPSIDIANGFASTIISLFGLFSGFMIRTSKIPDWWIWFHYISPQYYALEAVFANEFDGVKYGCPKNHGAYFIADPSSKSGEGRYYCPHTEGGAAIEELFDFHLDRKWQDIGILYSMAIFYLALVVVAIRYIKHINR